MTFGLFALSKNPSHRPFGTISVIDVVIPYKTNTRILLGVNTKRVQHRSPCWICIHHHSMGTEKEGWMGVVGRL